MKCFIAMFCAAVLSADAPEGPGRVVVEICEDGVPVKNEWPAGKLPAAERCGCVCCIIANRSPSSSPDPSRDLYLRGTDPFALFAQMLERGKIDPAHAFYLGYEMAKAATALTLSKNYVQDQALRWAFLTSEERSGHA